MVGLSDKTIRDTKHVPPLVFLDVGNSFTSCDNATIQQQSFIVNCDEINIILPNPPFHIFSESRIGQIIVLFCQFIGKLLESGQKD